MKVRLWKLGSLEYKVVPKPATLKKLRAAVEEATKDEKDVINFVWGPELEIQEFNGDFATVGRLISGSNGKVELSQESMDEIDELYTEEE